jgi:hypothetical protein
MEISGDKINLSTVHIIEFKRICGDRNVLTNVEDMDRYAHDETESLHFLPEVVLKTTKCTGDLRNFKNMQSG